MEHLVLVFRLPRISRLTPHLPAARPLGASETPRGVALRDFDFAPRRNRSLGSIAITEIDHTTPFGTVAPLIKHSSHHSAPESRVHLADRFPIGRR